MGPEIRELILARDWETIKQILPEWPAPDIADLVIGLDAETEMPVICRLLPQELQAEVFAELDPDNQETLLQQMNNAQIRQMLLELSPDDRTSLFEELSGAITQKLLNLLPANERRESLMLLGYPEYSVGRLMTPDYLAVQPSWTIEKALNHIKEKGHDAETIDRIYVIDEKWKLLDDLPIRKFLMGNPTNLVSSLMDDQFFFVYDNDNQEESIKKMERYRLVAMPVLSKEGILIGIVTIDDILDVLNEETTEDFHKSAAVKPLETKYISATFWDLYLKRIGWLILLFITYFFSSQIIAHYNDALEKIIALTFFIPVLTGTGGNVSTQASTLIIRAIGMGELSLKDWFKVLKKEFITSLFLGVTLSIALYFRAFLSADLAQLAIILGFSMVLIVIWANLVGSVLPIVLTKFKIDPAVVSGPLLATFIDCTGLILYFSIAKYFLGI